MSDGYICLCQWFQLSSCISFVSLYKYRYICMCQGSCCSGTPELRAEGTLKIQLGPCEILPEGPVDPKNWRICHIFYRGILQNLLGALWNSYSVGHGSSTEDNCQEPCYVCLITGTWLSMTINLTVVYDHDHVSRLVTSPSVFETKFLFTQSPRKFPSLFNLL